MNDIIHNVNVFLTKKRTIKLNQHSRDFDIIFLCLYLLLIFIIIYRFINEYKTPESKIGSSTRPHIYYGAKTNTCKIFKFFTNECNNAQIKRLQKELKHLKKINCVK